MSENSDPEIRESEVREPFPEQHAGEREDSGFTEKLEEALEGLIVFCRRYLRTLGLLFRHPLRAGDILVRDCDYRNYLPPLSFLVVSYFVVTTGIALAAKVYESSGLTEGEASFEKIYPLISAQLGSVDIAPFTLILLTLPMLVLLVGLATLAAWLAALDTRAVIAVSAYATAFAWTLPTATVLVGLTLSFVPIVNQIVMLAAFLFIILLIPILLVLILMLGIVILFIARAISAASTGRRKRAKLRAWTVLAVFVPLTVYGDSRLALTAVSARLRDPDSPDVDVDVRAFGFAPSDTPQVTTTIRKETGDFANRNEVEKADSAAQPLWLEVVLRNRSGKTLYMPRTRRSEYAPGPTLEFGILPMRIGMALSDTLYCAQEVPLSMVDWSDGGSPVLVLKSGDVKWMRAQAVVRGFSSPAEIDQAVMRLHLMVNEDDVLLASGWFAGFVNPDGVPGTRAPRLTARCAH